MFLSFSLDGWSDRAERWVKARFWRWLTASGRSDQSHRLAPMLRSGPTAEDKTSVPNARGRIVIKAESYRT